MNIQPLSSIGIVFGGGALIGVATKTALESAVSHEKKNPGGFPTDEVALGATILSGGAALFAGSAMRVGALGGTGTAAYALTAAAALGILGGAHFGFKG